MLRRNLLKLLALAPLARADAGHAGAAAGTDFLLFGDRALFAVHLCQYRDGRNFQVVLRLRDPQPRRGPLARRARRRLPVRFLAEELDLRRTRPGHPQRLRTLVGSPLGAPSRPLELEVLQVLVYAEVQAQGARPLEHDYIVFGHRSEWYATHVIGGAPDFQQILSLAGLPDSERLRLSAARRGQVPALPAGARELHFTQVEAFDA